jgi:GT2 family glycosyltransferase
MADVSILVVNWNTRDRLRRCLEALARLPDPVSCDVVVVDNGSTDGSAEMVASGFPSVRLLRNARNEGFARAVNRGVAETDAPFVLLLNSDAELQSGALATLTGTLRDHPDVAAAGAQLFKPDGRIQHAFDVFPSLLTELVNKGLLRRLWPSRHPSRLQSRSEPCEVDSLIGACMMIRRAAIDDVGGFDPRFFVFYEETDWCLRARRGGWHILLVPGARAIHGQGETKAHHPGRARVESWRSKYAYFDKHRGRRVRFFLQAVSFARLSVQVVALAVGVVLTLGLRESWRRKLVADVWLWAWHAAGAPSGFGFAPMGPVPGYVRSDDADGCRWLPVAAALSTRGTPLYRIHEFLDSDAARLLKEGRSKRHSRVTLARDGRHEDWYVKGYKRGGWACRIKSALRGSKAWRELSRMAVADRRGVPVSLPVMVADWVTGSRAGEGILVFLPLDGWETLDAWLRRAPAGAGGGVDGPVPRSSRRAVIRAFGRFARGVFDAGVDQDDFNPTNVFLRHGAGDAAELLLVDFERVVIRPTVPEARRARIVAKMLREPSWATRTDRWRFLRALLCASAGREARHAFARAVAAAWKRVQARDRARGKGTEGGESRRRA